MELVEIVARKNFHNTVIGDVTNKQRMRIPKHLAEQLATLNCVTILPNPYKAVPQIPALFKPPVNGEGVLHVSSQAAPVLPEPTATKRRRGRPPKAGKSSA